ncbi:MAG: hypothetical protein KBC26_02120 [Candidatus Pacebacteria bacterium]|nr:hypothetical protein [Candidatus Paceibacterota bacterium]
MRKILIISESVDVHANEVGKALQDVGHTVIRFDTDLFSSSFVELIFALTGPEEGIVINGKFFAFRDIFSVLYRRPGVPMLNVTAQGQREFAEKEIQELIKQIYFYLDNVLWVSHYPSLDKARRKYLQLKVAASFGMAVPKTLVTNSPQRIRDFFNLCSGGMVYKTLHSPVIRSDSGPELWGVPTTLINSQLVDFCVDLIRPTGGIFQEYIPKDYEVRVTIIGEDVFASKIDSQSDPSAIIDWREAVAYGKVKVSPYVLPEEIRIRCLSIVRWYGLSFGAIDLIRKPNGDYVFLELNPNGQWLWVEELTDQPLLSSMCDLLGKGLKRKGN